MVKRSGATRLAPPVIGNSFGNSEFDITPIQHKRLGTRAEVKGAGKGGHAARDGRAV